MHALQPGNVILRRPIKSPRHDAGEHENICGILSGVWDRESVPRVTAFQVVSVCYWWEFSSPKTAVHESIFLDPVDIGKLLNFAVDNKNKYFCHVTFNYFHRFIRGIVISSVF